MIMIVIKLVNSFDIVIETLDQRKEQKENEEHKETAYD